MNGSQNELLQKQMIDHLLEQQLYFFALIFIHGVIAPLSKAQTGCAMSCPQYRAADRRILENPGDKKQE